MFLVGCGFLSAKGDNYAKTPLNHKEVFFLSMNRFFRRVKFNLNLKIDFYQFNDEIYLAAQTQSTLLL
jgi:hypothetical protein